VAGQSERTVVCVVHEAKVQRIYACLQHPSSRHVV